MFGIHPRSLVQTIVLLLILGAARYTAVFESTAGKVIGGLVLLVVGIDIVWLTWRRFQSGS
jgi:hypothetical protein